ncbi:hypothetical protein JCM8097_004848 [Rhodosporidiobolus ruineniae]
MKEKSTLPPPAALSRPTPTTRNPLLVVVAVAVLLLLSPASPLGTFSSCSNSHKALLRPQSGIYWSPCPDVPDTLCSFLNVPLDYTDPQSAEIVSLALRMIPATAPAKEQLGYLFMNPGGPGGSGTGALVDLAPILPKIYNGRYNLISWDPRGVNMTTPPLNCFETVGDGNRFQRDLEQLGLSFEARGSPSLGFTKNASDAAELNWVTKVDGFARALRGACDANAHQKMLRASSTAFSARDMKSIMEALGEEKVNYWGFSYGTILGATFSAMFPELVGRVILDSVSNAQLYTNDLLGWGKSGMADTHKTYEGFFHHCAVSGPAGCKWARENSTAAELTARYDALLEKLRETPVPVATSKIGPGTLTASDVQYTMFHTLPEMAGLINDVEAGNPSEMYYVSNVAAVRLGRKPPTHKNPFGRPTQSMISSTAAIMCSDTHLAGLDGMTTREVQAFMKEMRDETGSPTADVWAVWISACMHWAPKAFERYNGPWTVEDGLKKTNNTILFFSQTADPVTPLLAAKAMVAGFGEDSARLLVQNGFGHCSFAHPSLCTAKAYRNYLLDNVLPEPNSTCDGDPAFLFPHPGETGTTVEALSQEDRELKEALEELSKVAGKWRMGPL